MIIKDADGPSLRITSEGRAKTYSVAETEAYHSGEEGLAYHMVIEETPTGPDDCFVYFKNSNEKPVIVVGYSAYGASGDVAEFYLSPTGTPAGGTTNDPVNVNSGSGEVVDGTFESGSDITGLTKGSLIHRGKIGTNQSYELFPSGIWVAKNSTFGIWAVTGTTQINMTILLHYEPTL